MVCPHCHSDQIIAVQDQHFCINCGQLVPEEPVKKTKTKSVAGIAVAANGLPEGVTIIGGGTPPAPSPAEPAKPAPKAPPKPQPAEAVSTPVIIKSRDRFATPTAVPAGEPTAEPKTTKAKKRKPGRPKAGRLDTPRPLDPVVPAPAAAPSDPKIINLKALEGTPETPPAPVTPPAPAGPKRLNDLEPRLANPTQAVPKPAKPEVHKVATPPLHFGPILRTTLVSRSKPRHLLLAGLAALCFAVAAGYAAWLVLHGGISGLTKAVTEGGTRLVVEGVILLAIYYIGRNLGHAAIIYGVVREADQRPVGLGRSLGVAVNTFLRRIWLDGGFYFLQAALIGAAVALVLTGGSSWPINPQLQVATLFTAFMSILYLLTALGIARGLASVSITLTGQNPWAAAKLGWQLFAHRFELLGLRFLVSTVELVLAVPLVAIAVTIIAATPATYHLAAAVGVGVIAWLAGAMFGSGTAAWWASLYRNLVTTDRTDQSKTLLQSNQPTEANRAALAAVVAVSSFLISAVLALPWLAI